MTTIAKVIYHYEDEGWWAESPDVPGWTATDADLSELRHLVREGLRFAVDRPVAVFEYGLPDVWLSGNPGAAVTVTTTIRAADGSDGADPVVKTPWPREATNEEAPEPQLAA